MSRVTRYGSGDVSSGDVSIGDVSSDMSTCGRQSEEGAGDFVR